MPCCVQVPLLKLPPSPWKPGLTLQDRVPVTKELDDVMRDMLTKMNDAIKDLPDLRHTQHARRSY